MVKVLIQSSMIQTFTSQFPPSTCSPPPSPRYDDSFTYRPSPGKSPSFHDILSLIQPPHKRRGHHLSIFKRRQSRQTSGLTVILQQWHQFSPSSHHGFRKSHKASLHLCLRLWLGQISQEGCAAFSKACLNIVIKMQLRDFESQRFVQSTVPICTSI